MSLKRPVKLHTKRIISDKNAKDILKRTKKQSKKASDSLGKYYKIIIETKQ